MNRGTSLVLATVCVSAVSCGRSLDLNLVVSDPCNVDVLVANDLEFLEVLVESPQLERPARASWTVSEAQGTLSDLDPVSSATVTVIGRNRNGSGGPGDAVFASGVGYLDLSGANEQESLDLNVAVGRVKSFFRTTDTENYASRKCTQLVAERRGHTATLLDTGVVLIAGGARVNSSEYKFWGSTEFFDPRSGRFTKGPDMVVREGHTASRLRDGRVLLAGGVSLINGQPDNSRIANTYDPSDGSVGASIPMQSKRAHHTATVLDDGRVLMVGGSDGNSELDTTEIFDPAAGAFTTGPKLLAARAHHAAVLVSRSIVAVIGGRGGSSVLDSVEFIDVAHGAVAPGPHLEQARSHSMATLVTGRDAILVAGGFGTAVTGPEVGTGLATAEIIQLSQTLTSSQVVCSDIALAAPRGDGAMAPLGDGAFVLVGGVAAPGDVNAGAEILTVGGSDICDVNVAVAGGPMTSGRAGIEATPLIGGDVLITGGYEVQVGGQAASSAIAEIFVRPR